MSQMLSISHDKMRVIWRARVSIYIGYGSISDTSYGALAIEKPGPGLLAYICIIVRLIEIYLVSAFAR